MASAPVCARSVSWSCNHRGVASADTVIRKPITAALSGSAAGSIGAPSSQRLQVSITVSPLRCRSNRDDLWPDRRCEPHLTNSGHVGRFPGRIPIESTARPSAPAAESIAGAAARGALRVRAEERRAKSRAPWFFTREKEVGDEPDPSGCEIS